MTTKLKFLACTALIGAMLPASAAFSVEDTTARTTTEMGATATTEDGALAGIEEGTTITLSGTIARIVEDDELFVTSRYGEVKVDINDDLRNWFNEDAQELFRVGERITVTGEVDEDFLAGRELDAEYITLTGETYSMNYSADMHTPAAKTKSGMDSKSAASAKTPRADYYVFYPYDDQNLRLSGTVQEVKDDDSVVMGFAGGGQLEVDISDIRRNTQGYKLNRGDFITVYGDLKNPESAATREFEASRIIRTDEASGS